MRKITGRNVTNEVDIRQREGMRQKS